MEGWVVAEIGQSLAVRRSASPGSGVAQEWANLAGRAVVPSARNHPDVVIPTLEALPQASVFTVHDGSQILLAAPLGKLSRGLPLWSNLITPLTNGDAPHVDAEQGATALAALLGHLEAPLLLQGIPAEGDFWTALTASGARLKVLRRWQRAGLLISGSYDQWLSANVDTKRRKEYRRLRARLAEMGDLHSEVLGPGEPAGPWVDDFLQLEAAGWKGGRGTALNQQPGFAKALHEIAEAMHARGALRFWRIRLNDKTLGTLFAMVEGGQAWLGKITYDQAFARFSPGVMVIFDATESLFAEPGLKQADSCAIPDHPMINNIWRHRLDVADVLVAGPGVSSLRFNATAAAENLRHNLRSSARDALLRLRGRKRS